MVGCPEKEKPAFSGGRESRWPHFCDHAV